MNRGLYVAWLLVTGLDALGCVLVAARQRQVKHRFGSYAALFAMGVAVESAVAFGSLALFPPMAAEEFAVGRIVGRLIGAATAWAFALYLMGFINGVRPRSGEAKRP